MGLNLAEKILTEHLISGEIKKGNVIEIKINQTLLQDALGTMACLQFEAMELDKINTDLSIIYVDHNTLQTGYENADDHVYLQSFAEKYGLYYSKPGNGICHQVHLERFGYPGGTLIGSDSHTPTCGGLGMLSMGAGGLDVSVAMATGVYNLKVPDVIEVELKGKLSNGCAAKDIILKLLSILSVKGGVGKIIEYTGEGISGLTVYDRATITNMGAELGATSSIFPSDYQTKLFLEAQGRGECFKELKADADAIYADKIAINLDELEPLIALPHSPDNVKKVSESGKVKVDQVCIGSCTNSSYGDLMIVAKALEGKTIHKDVSLVISPGSKQVLNMLAMNGALSSIISSGARILESACGPCIGMGQAPKSGGVSLRTFNRNFEKRSGTDDAKVYLVSPETAVASALTGYITALDMDVSGYKSTLPEKFIINDNLILKPKDNGNKEQELIKGKNIKPFAIFDELKDSIEGKSLIKVEDNITTDHIVPGGAKALSNRSNIPFLSDYCLVRCEKHFPANAKKYGGGFIIGGENYGQGSSREHAALVPVYLGIRAVIAKSFARIHKSNLINTGILPLEFSNPNDYNRIDFLDDIILVDVKESLMSNKEIKAINKTKNFEFNLLCNAADREREILVSGGMIRYVNKNVSF
ncbi:aconitate hydratase [Sedimentibacter sp.]|uniref:aconitate hydratase n=1 Tax=Sedimentibacter sp. TaxID=1960295 RepID=UPI0028AFA4A2|nr:aconitate hydratase [Sedimentibacter sp.]